MGLYIFLAIIYTIILLIWTKVNRSSSEDIRMDRREFREEVREKREQKRKVESVRVIFRDMSDVTFDDARSYQVNFLDRAYELYDMDGAIVAEFPNREVSAIVMNRIGDTYER